MEKIKLLNTYVDNVTMNETVNEINNIIKEKRKEYIVAVNVDVIMKIEYDKDLKEAADNADMVLVDGKPLIWISKLYKRPVKEKISGSDLVPQLCALASRENYSIFILGGKENVTKQAKKCIERDYDGIKEVYTYSPPFGFEKDTAELEHINNLISAKRPDILIACFGCPKQEKWIYENIKKYDAKVSVCAGATVDFMAGKVKRAPSWISEHGFEWLFRFLQEPKRLFKRYFIDDIKIVNLVWKYRR